MASAHRQKRSTLKDVVDALIDALNKSGHLPQKVAQKLSNLLSTTDSYGCCTFMMAGHTYHSNMTEQDCNRLNGTWLSSPC